MSENKDVNLNSGIKENEEVLVTAETDFSLLSSPIELSEEDIDKLIESKEFKEGYKKGAELVGLYTAMISNGVDVITANNILIYEHSNKWKLEHIKADNKNIARNEIEKELKGI